MVLPRYIVTDDPLVGVEQFVQQRRFFNGNFFSGSDIFEDESFLELVGRWNSTTEVALAENNRGRTLFAVLGFGLVVRAMESNSFA